MYEIRLTTLRLVVYPIISSVLYIQPVGFSQDVTVQWLITMPLRIGLWDPFSLDVLVIPSDPSILPKEDGSGDGSLGTTQGSLKLTVQRRRKNG